MIRGRGKIIDRIVEVLDGQVLSRKEIGRRLKDLNPSSISYSLNNSAQVDFRGGKNHEIYYLTVQAEELADEIQSKVEREMLTPAEEEVLDLVMGPVFLDELEQVSYTALHRMVRMKVLEKITFNRNARKGVISNREFFGERLAGRTLIYPADQVEEAAKFILEHWIPQSKSDKSLMTYFLRSAPPDLAQIIQCSYSKHAHVNPNRLKGNYVDTDAEYLTALAQ